MKRVLSSIGIGAATVDTVFPRTELEPGETVTAEVELYGGESTQKIDRIYFDIKTQYPDGEVRVLKEFSIDEQIVLEPGDESTVPVDIEIPLWTPLTEGDVSVWLETGLDIDWAKDPTDEDQVEIVADEYIAALFEAVEELGFALKYTELVEPSYLEDRPFAQEYDFRPTDEQYARELAELDVTLIPQEENLRVFLEFETRDKIADQHDMEFNEQQIPVAFDRADAGLMKGRLKKELNRHT